jgi:hypothetical protein
MSCAHPDIVAKAKHTLNNPFFISYVIDVFNRLQIYAVFRKVPNFPLFIYGLTNILPFLNLFLVRLAFFIADFEIHISDFAI